MAPVSDRSYFPPLEECLTKERVLLSWRHIATALQDSTGERQTAPAVIDFFDDDYVHEILDDPSKAFAPPSETTKKDFETKTAPINITPASNGRYDLKNVKQDAEWLSKTANINLVAALRVVVIEYQARPSQYLTGPLSSQDASNLQEAAGLSSTQGSALVSDLGGSLALDADEISGDFEKPASQKLRLFRTYLSEKRYLILASDYANSIRVYGRLPTFASVKVNLAQVYRLNLSGPANDSRGKLISSYLSVVGNAMSRLEAGLGSVTDDELLAFAEIELEWATTLLTETVHALSVVFQLADSSESGFPVSSAVNQWFSLMGVYGFFEELQAIDQTTAELIMAMRTLASAISIVLLSPACALTYLAERDDDQLPAEDDSYDSYLLSSEVLEQIHKTIMQTASIDSQSATPAIFAWTLILHRMNASYQTRTEKRDNLLQHQARENFEIGREMRPTPGRRNSAGSIFSIESSKFDGFLESTALPKDHGTTKQLATAATANGKVFDVMSDMATALGPSPTGSSTPLLSSRIRTAFFELLKVSYPVIGYQSEPVNSLLTLLSVGRDYWGLTDQDNLSSKQDILAEMIKDDYAMENFFQQALDRFPYEFMPFITLCRALCSTSSSFDEDRADFILNLLRRTPTLTFPLPKSFQAFELVQEDESTNTFRLLEDIPLISLSTSWSRRHLDEDPFRIPAGTYGRFVTYSGRLVIMDYPHSALALLGRQLEISLVREGYQTNLQMPGPDEVAEVITLLATLIRSDHLKAERRAQSAALAFAEDDILQESSRHISGGKDIVTVVCETMDHFMQDELPLADPSAIQVLSACIRFLDAILPLQPSRVWSYLARSELLGSDSVAGKLNKITGSLDLVSERFDFLKSSLSLFSSLIDTAMTSAVQRRAGTKSAGRQRAENNPWLGSSDKVLSRVSYSIAQASVDIFENSSTWRFDSETDRTSLLHTVVPILNKIVVYSYDMGDSEDSNSLTSCLRPAADYVIDCFMAPSTGTLRFQPLLTTFTAALTNQISTLHPTRRQLGQEQVSSVLEFSTSLLRVANYLEKPSAMIETYLFKCSTLLARLCAASDSFRNPAIKLIEALVVNASKAASEPPSLLGYLGLHISKAFLQLLSTLGKPFVISDDVKTTWQFFSSILRNRQQWMSNCLLTGQTPREAMKDNRKTELSADSVFAAALARLKSIQTLRSSEALAILDFVASAQNYWPWTTFTLQSDGSYLEALREYVKGLKPSHLTVKNDAVQACIEARLAAYIAEILAMQLYHARHQGNAGPLAQSLHADLDYYLRDAVEVGGYNKSLHANLEKNFSNKFQGCSVNSFKRTLLKPGELGWSYFYQLDRADQMLQFDPSWLGRKDNGFKTEMELSNANLSLVDAQIALFHAWEFLLLELSTCLPDNDDLIVQLLQVAQQCLDANQKNSGPERIFRRLSDRRADFALALIQRLVKTRLQIKSINQLLGTVVVAINAVEEPFAEESIAYYRVLLKTLFVVLRAFQLSGARSDPDSPVDLQGSTVSVTQTVLNLLDRVVGRGFRTLVSLIHDKDSPGLAEDLALITAILQACLSIPSMENSQTQILNIMSSHDAVHAATSLFSWADSLAENGDPFYGELSILFLLELSTLPQVAEQLACDGILSSMMSANLFKFMLRSDISPYADIMVSQRCYAIWAKGLLPLMLNLITSLGATIAPEIAYVLNQFPHLLSASVERFETPGASRMEDGSSSYITLIATSEIHSLALLTRIITALRLNNSRDIPEVKWDGAGLLENVEYWLTSKRLLKERLLALGDRQMEWRNTRTPGEDSPCDNVLEAKVVSQLEVVRDVLSEEMDS